MRGLETRQVVVFFLAATSAVNGEDVVAAVTLRWKL